MFLKSLKQNSNKKYVNKLLSKNKRLDLGGKINTVGIVLNYEEINSFEEFHLFLKKLGFHSPKNRIVACTDSKLSDEQNNEFIFDNKCFGWSGTVKNQDLKSFINEPYDLLISFYKHATTELNLVSAASKAKFKVGILEENSDIYDLILNIDPNNKTLFFEELKKYLHILKKI